MPEPLIIDGKRYLTSKQAARLVGYTSDYVGQLYRAGKIEGKLVGRSLWINEDKLKVYAETAKVGGNGTPKKASVISSPSDEMELNKAISRQQPEVKSTVTYHKDERPLMPVVAPKTVAPSLEKAATRIVAHPVTRTLAKHSDMLPQLAVAVLRTGALSMILVSLILGTYASTVHNDEARRQITLAAESVKASALEVKENTSRGADLIAATIERFSSLADVKTNDERLALSSGTLVSPLKSFAKTFNTRVNEWLGFQDDAPVYVPTGGATSPRLVVATNTISQTIVKTVVERPTTIVQNYGVTRSDLDVAVQGIRNELTAIRLQSQKQNDALADSFSRGIRSSGGGGSSQNVDLSNISGSNISNSVITTSSFSGSTGDFTGNVTIGGSLTVSSLANCDTIDTDALGNFTCGVDSGAGGGISSLNGLNNVVQTFATSTADANLRISIVSSGSTHTFVPSWNGTLASGRGGTGISSVTANELLIGNSAGTGWTQTATSSLGLPTFADVSSTVASNLSNYLSLSSWYATTTDALDEGVANLYWTNNRFDTRFDNRITATTSLPSITTLAGLTSAPSLATVGTITSGTWNGTAIGDAYITKSGNWTGTFDGQEGAYYLDRANHTGTQLSTTISNFDAAVNAYIHSSTTIPKTYTANTFTAGQTFGNATSTNFEITGQLRQLGGATSTFSNGLNIAGGCFAVNGTCLTAGSGGTSFPYAFPLAGNATSSLVQFNGGLTAFSSSTIGSGTQQGGLTISGGATTTGSAYIAGNLGVGTTSPSAKFAVAGNIYTSGEIKFENGLTIGNYPEPDATQLLDQNDNLIGMSETGINIGALSFDSFLSLTDDYFRLGFASGSNGIQADPGGVTISGNSVFNSGTTVFTGGNNVGIGTTSPYARLSVVGQVVASSFTGTSTATSSFAGPFVNTSTATSTFAQGINLSAGCFAINGTCLTAGSGGTSFPYAFPLAGNATSSLVQFNGGLTAFSSSTIGSGTQQGGLTISGGATTTGSAYIAGNLGVGTTSPVSKLAITGTTTIDGGLNIIGDTLGKKVYSGFIGPAADTAFYISTTPDANTTSAPAFYIGGGTGDYVGMYGAGYNSAIEIGNGIAYLYSSAGSIVADTDGVNITGSGRTYISNNLGVGTSTPGTKFSVVGAGHFTSNLQAANITATGTATAAAFTTGGLTTTNTLTISSLADGCLEVAGGVVSSTGTNCGIGSGGITSLGGQTGSSQTFATSTAGADFTITSSSNVHTFNLPFASVSANGKLSSADWTTFNNKVSSSSLTTALGDYLSLSSWYATTTDALDEGIANLYYTPDRVNAYINSSTTIPKTYTANTFTAGQTFGNATSTNFEITGQLRQIGGATSTFSNGLNIAAGCFAVNGVCLTTGGGGGSGTVGAGTAGQLPYYAANGTTLTATSTIFLASNGNVGVGTTTPATAFAVNGTTTIIGALDVRSIFEDYGSINVGYGNTVPAENTLFSFGSGNTFSLDESFYSAAFGQNNSIQAQNSYAFGSLNAISVDGSYVLGTSITNDQAGSVMIGTGESSKITIDSGGKVGIGTESPATALDVYRSGSELPALRIRDGDLATNDYSGIGFNPALTADTMGQMTTLGSSAGGLQFQGFAQSGQPTGIRLAGYSGSTTPTSAGVVTFQAWKHNGTTGRTALVDVENAFEFQSGTRSVMNILGNGNIGIGSSTPMAKLTVSGEVMASHFTGTTTASSTFAGPIVNTSTATSTFARGINLSGGCFAINGTCLTAGTGGSSFAYPFGLAGNATSSLVQFNGGLTAVASSTIGSGTQQGGLTVSGGATTTGSAYIAGNLGVGTTTTGAKLSVAGSGLFDGTVTASNFVGTSTASSTFAGPIMNTFAATSTFAGSVAIGRLTAHQSLHVSIPYGRGETTNRDGFFLSSNEELAAGLNISLTGAATQALRSATLQTLVKDASSVNTYAGNLLFQPNGGNVGIGTTSPYARLSVVGDVVAERYVATSTTATSTFAGNAQIGGNLQVGNSSIYLRSNATSTFDGGINLSAGCFAINGTCISGGGGGGSGTVGSGTAGQLPYYAANGTTLTATSTIFLASNGHVGIGTTTPNSIFSVQGTTTLIGVLDTRTTFGEDDQASVNVGYNNIVTDDSLNVAFGIGNTLDNSFLSGTYGTSNTIGSGNLYSYAFGRANSITVDDAYAFGQGIINDRSGTVMIGSSESGKLTIDSGGGLGIGTESPATALDIYRSGSELPAFRMRDGDLTMSDYSGVGFNPALTTDTMGQVTTLGSTAGGLQFQGFAQNGQPTGIRLAGYSGSTTPTSAGVVSFQAWKHNGTNNRTALTGTDTAFEFLSGTQSLMMVTGNGNVGIGTTSPYAKLSVVGEVVASYFTATSTATSTFAGPFVNTSTATSTWANGINLSTGCFAIGGTCVGGGGSGTVGSGLTGQFPFYAANGTTLTASSTLYLDATGRIGIGTTTPGAKFAVAGDIYTSGQVKFANGGVIHGPEGDAITIEKDLTALYLGTGSILLTNQTGPDNASFEVAQDQINLSFGSGSGLISVSPNAVVMGGSTFTVNNTTSQFNGGLNVIGGNVGIGTTSPYAKLSVVGEVVASYFTATSTATSTFAGPFVNTSTATSTWANGINLSTGCFAIGGTCVGGGSSSATVHSFVQFTTSSTTYVPPVGWKSAKIMVIGGGGGGGSGAKLNSGTQSSGGGGGAGGHMSVIEVASTAFGTGNWNISIGAGGTGGASQTTNGQNGSNGISGGTTEVSINSVKVAVADGGANGLPGRSSNGAGGTNSTGKGMYPGTNGAGNSLGTAGASAGNNAVPLGSVGANGAASGGGITTGAGHFTGGATAGDWILVTSNNVSGGTAGGGNGGTPTDNGYPRPGGAGSGGGSNNAGNGGNGGSGYKGGGGGGGGSSISSLGDSGAGGNGGDGYVAIWFEF